MEIIISAVLGELTTRSINFFTSKIFKPTPADVEDRLRRVLLRGQVITDESMGRQITNQAMLIQLGMVRDALYRGQFMLDTFSCQSHDEDRKDKVMRHSSSSLSKVNYLKRLSLSSRNTLVLKQLQETLDDLSSMILDVEELVVYLMSCPRLRCQPYSMHLQLANSMFGRQTEAQRIINFLLHTQPHDGAEELEVLPIVGPSQVGKSTLVAHVCKDERVCGHFSDILFFRIHGLTNDELTTFRDSCEMRYQNCLANNNKEGSRLLVVVELSGDLNEDAWNWIYSASKLCLPTGSKIIVTSRSDKIVRFRTTKALTLKYLSHEAYWYFFKTLTFGSTDAKMHPSLMYLAMEIARTMNSSFIGANVTARLLRDNFDAHFWCKVLVFLRGSFQKHVTRFGEHPFDLLNQNRPANLGRMATPAEDFVLYHQYQRSPEDEVPKIRIQDVMYGSVKPHGKFEVLAWSAQIPPYYSYVFACEIRELATTATKRKRSAKKGVTLS
ncbi:hypothetical protein GQ55_2G012700 [Panicum hallii var. hallii]|uniref:NB-ARC domain-containing protein n=1 Tax=Panicum hallii var. hallii TaxID=1504633 RepID=A0A2T7EKB9_9POAL|nr:hypothetical protein GQ55_2G012700 [Panicum hallii var. hallii]